jgi:hypothetical protein
MPRRKQRLHETTGYDQPPHSQNCFPGAQRNIVFVQPPERELSQLAAAPFAETGSFKLSNLLLHLPVLRLGTSRAPDTVSCYACFPGTRRAG